MPNGSLDERLIEQLKACRRGLKGGPKLADEISRRTGRTISRSTIENAIAGKPLHDESHEAILEYCRLPSSHEHLHQERWTGKIAPPAGLFRRLDASEFKRLLIAAEGPTLPRRFTFVSPTGQWLKPIVNHFLRHGIELDLYVCDPSTVLPLAEGGPDVAKTLAILQFFWSMPHAFALDRAHKASVLRVRTYRDHLLTPAAAYAEDELVAISAATEASGAPEMNGHPASGSRVRQGPQPVDVYLSGNQSFAGHAAAVHQIIDTGTDPCVTWSPAGAFTISPALDLDPAASFSPSAPPTAADTPAPEIITKNPRDRKPETT